MDKKIGDVMFRADTCRYHNSGMLCAVQCYVYGLSEGHCLFSYSVGVEELTLRRC